jgi:MFS family permease
MNLNIALLALSQASMMTVISLVLSSSALIGLQLSSPDLATLPLAVQYLATMILLYPIARLMERYGRKLIFLMGALFGAIGLSIAAIGINFGSFMLFALAGFLIGIFNAVGQYYRFAAAEAVPGNSKSIAISLTLTGGILAAIAGPILARYTKNILQPTFLASFISLIVVALLGAFVASRMTLARVSKEDDAGSKRSLYELARNPRFLLAVSGGVIGYSIMNLLMCATPLAMLCAHLDFSQTATVIQWHIVAMFAPSLFTGILIRKIGVYVVMLLGCMAILLGVVVAINGDELVYFELALIFLGVGWNFLYIGSTTLLTETYRPIEKSLVQSFNDTLVFLSVTIATFFSARLVNNFGWEAINIYASIPIILLALGIIFIMRSNRIGLRLD